MRHHDTVLAVSLTLPALQVLAPLVLALPAG